MTAKENRRGELWARIEIANLGGVEGEGATNFKSPRLHTLN